ncbi:hypothetical protein MSAR_03600 [Mycolicibacterium sarraceniae]|uniref:Glycerol acyltransferase n=1 Tax=Mycolicibacterium sarraceniae TaxID=1534348 RepID=A0A7I7SJT8_9MYCO|nr:hypothetical protein MSAR_03600 [Mycolicibacterium sarraceniae]
MGSRAERAQVAVMDHPPRVRALERALGAVADGIRPVVDLWRPYLGGLSNLPIDGRFLLVGNHTQMGGAETFLIPYAVRRQIGVRVRPLADRQFGQIRGLPGDLLAAYGGVVGAPDTARELMDHDQTILVFPGGRSRDPEIQGRGIHPALAGAVGIRPNRHREGLSDRAGRARRR